MRLFVALLSLVQAAEHRISTDNENDLIVRVNMNPLLVDTAAPSKFRSPST
jgi:hypothetical protein